MGRNLIRTGLTALAITLAAPAFAQAATTYTVNTEADNPAGALECLGVPLDCSIRQALDKAQTGDTVSIPAGHYVVDPQNGPLQVTKEMSIVGTGNPVIDGDDQTRVFEIGTSDTTLAISVDGVTVTNGHVSGGFGGNAGAGFLVFGALTLTNSTVSDNRSDFNNGAGLALAFTEDNQPSARIIASTFTGNTALNGGAISNIFGSLVVINSTIIDNRAGNEEVSGAGGGIYTRDGTTELFNDTIVENEAFGNDAVGGNLYDASEIAAVAASEGTFGAAVGGAKMKNTIVADGIAPAGPNCGGANPASQGNNLVSDGQCATSPDNNDISSPANLGPFGSNGGPTQTLKPLVGSNAIDKGASAGCVDDKGNPITVDQRGIARPLNGRCEIGSVEIAPPLAVTTDPNSVTKASATINGNVTNPDIFNPGSAYFEFGTSTAYGQTFQLGAVAPGASHDPRNQDVTGLSPGVLYHYRIVTSNPDGTSIGEDKTFITLVDPPPGEPDPTPTPEPTPQPKPKPKPHKPTVRSARASTGCVRRQFGLRLSVHVSAAGKLKHVDVFLDGKRVKRTTKHRFSVHVSARHLRPGTHVVKVVASDSTGRHTTIRRMFRRCRPPAQPAFTG